MARSAEILIFAAQGRGEGDGGRETGDGRRETGDGRRGTGDSHLGLAGVDWCRWFRWFRRFRLDREIFPGEIFPAEAPGRRGESYGLRGWRGWGGERGELRIARMARMRGGRRETGGGRRGTGDGAEAPERLPPEGGTPTRGFTDTDLPVGVPASAGSLRGPSGPGKWEQGVVPRTDRVPRDKVGSPP